MCEGTLSRILLGFLCLCANLAGTNATSRLRLDPPRAVVEYGSPVSVTCTADAPNDFLSWEKSQGETVPLEDRRKLNWTVQSVTDWGMRPFCYMIDGDEQPRLQFNITIYKTPDHVSISTVGHSGPMTEDEQYELQCDIQNVAPVQFLTVKLFQGESLVANKSFTDLNPAPVNQTVKFQITPGREDNGTEYRCQAELNLGPDGPHPPPTVKSDPLPIIVHYGPEVSCTYDHFTVKEGEEFNTNCTVEGNPPPDVSWWKEGEHVDFPQRMKRVDGGEYTVIANSNGLIANHTLEIVVLYPPSSILELQNTSVDHGYDKVLKCSSSANPRPRYEWKYNHAPNVGYQDEDGVSLLYIDYATEDNSGTYTCVAFNDLGQQSKSVTVDVRVPSDMVSISTENHTGPMIENSTYVLRCDVQYVAPVDSIIVMWYKGETVLGTSSTMLTVENTAKTPKRWFATHKVSHNRADNGTQYKCAAKLKQKMDGDFLQIGTSAPLNVIVHYKPIINQNKLPSVVPVFRGYPEVLVCEAEGYPQPKITWTMKSHTKVEEGNLTIMEATNDNVGLYTCTANNSVDTVIRVVKVIMKEDYLPLIAGFVALVVVITSVIFVVIYSIYYKNTKMGHYTVEGAKPSAQKGNVAQNGKENPIPMKTLTQNSIHV